MKENKLKRFVKKWKKILIPAGALLLVGIIVIVNIRQKGEVKKVRAEEVQKGEIKSVVSGPGRVRPKTEVDISSDIMGKIILLNVKEGDRVKQRKVLALLDDTNEKAELETATANFNFTERSFERKQKLFSEDLISSEEFQQAEAEYKTIQMRVENARRNFEKTRIITPISGIVTKLNVEEGEIVVTGTMNNPGTVLMTIADLSSMEVTTSIDESEVVDIKAGQPAEIEIDAYPDTSFKGEVSEIANTGSIQRERTFEEVTNFDVEVTVLDSVGALRPGMTATVDIITAERDSALKVPIQSIVMRNPKKEEKDKKDEEEENQEEGEGNWGKDKKKKIEGVFIVKEGKVEFTPVETGISNETHIEVLEGVQEKEQIVTGPFRTLNDLEDGDLVKLEKKGKGKGNWKKGSGR
jgi:HlyD family secretion protein